ncbi:hypothetical protein ISF_08249 [Cordyceps fumosorosea ARSEF 2679]|uniref:Nucleotide-binding, alpha-beta plait n=1 Tax=Cordyceps fumosorosea (strain ARSEF 2679) TaxID=1081104 RepID=A0A167MQJ3_CORFA|nr:hypothetical protein ISF_08249 [Cordyceps fumosorosea ARSEF 2679]OAA54648.1 hypothetical protein ISF_08249 [Cordyceps fumosorosea ARSEF 2679]
MSFFDKNTDGNLQQNYGNSESSGGVTPTPKSPTHGISAHTGRQTPSLYYSRPQPFATGHVHGDAGSARQSVRNIWDDANRAGPQNTTSASTSSMPPQIVIQELTGNSDYGTASVQRRMTSTPAHARGADPQMDIQTGFSRLRLVDSMSEHAPTSADVPTRSHGNPYSYGTHTSATPAILPTMETRPPQSQFSIWSTYGSQTNPSSSRSTEIELLSDPYVSGSGDLPVRAGAAALPRPRPSSEASSNLTPAHMPPPQRHFSTQLIPSTITMRIGQYKPPQPATQPDHRGPSGGGGGPALNPPQQPPPGPFLIQPRNQGFLPMHAVHSRQDISVSAGGGGMPPMAPLGMPLAPPRQPAPANRFSDRYHGMHTESNASAEHLTSEQNASLWITNLPPDITHHELLGQIRRVGRVWCCFINGPDGVKHATAAAKIVFFQPAAAQLLLQQTSLDGLSVRGWRAKVAPNRIKTGATIPRGGDDSRVLLVTGQAHFVNEQTLTRYFSERFVFQVDEVRELARGGAGRAVVEFRFGSYRCQAQMGKISLEKDRPLGFEKAEFGEDPCETGETWTSYSIALQRIQGHGL